MKRLVRAAEAWVWVQIITSILGLAVVGTAAWMCWKVVNHTAQVFGL